MDRPPLSTLSEAYSSLVMPIITAVAAKYQPPVNRQRLVVEFVWLRRSRFRFRFYGRHTCQLLFGNYLYLSASFGRKSLAKYSITQNIETWQRSRYVYHIIEGITPVCVSSPSTMLVVRFAWSQPIQLPGWVEKRLVPLSKEQAPVTVFDKLLGQKGVHKSKPSNN